MPRHTHQENYRNALLRPEKVNETKNLEQNATEKNTGTATGKNSDNLLNISRLST